MKGLELSRLYWEQVGLPAFAEGCPEIMDRIAAGLVGEGSECFGCDDEISRDHDWGPGFCLWLSDADFAQYGKKAADVYASMPESFMGFQRLRQSSYTSGRVGVMTVRSFYARYTGLDRAPLTIREWRLVPENGLSVVTNGQIFADKTGEFTAIRQNLLSYYPEELRKKKLAKACALAAQQGQYNYLRCLRHGEDVAALMALSQFMENAQKIAFLLAKKYRPYYKWSQRVMKTLPSSLPEAAEGMDRIASDSGIDRVRAIEQVSAVLIGELKRQGLSSIESDYLLDHAAAIQSSITDPELARLHLMAE